MVPSEAQRLCFVLMPFAGELLEVYTTAIRSAAEAAGLRCERADDIDQPGVVLDQIDGRIEESSVIVADLTHLNPNVMHELGFARRSGKPIVLITQDSPSGLPFDVRHFRVIQYQQRGPALTELRDRLSRVLAEIANQSTLAAPLAAEGPVLMRLIDFQQRIQPQLEAEDKEIVLPDPAGVHRCEGLGYQQATISQGGRNRPIVIGSHADRPDNIPMWRPRLSENAKRVILFAYRAGGMHPRCVRAFTASGVTHVNIGEDVLRDPESTRVLREVRDKGVMTPQQDAPHLYCLTEIGIARAEELQRQ